ncbi:MAG: tetratricopeptide repeat protein, partial [Actinobacteria bacterium]|nr:tetratricopeptide repeat protein [Actinomycetota bacterium]
HPNTLRARGNLATSYWSAGRTNDAIELMEQVVASAPDVLGADHPHTALFLQALEHLRNET